MSNRSYWIVESLKLSVDVDEWISPAIHGLVPDILLVRLVDFEEATQLVDLSVHSLFQDQFWKQLSDLLKRNIKFQGQELKFDSSVWSNFVSQHV